MRSPRYHRGDPKPAPGPRCPGSPAEAFPMISESHEAPRKETMSCRALSPMRTRGWARHGATTGSINHISRAAPTRPTRATPAQAHQELWPMTGQAASLLGASLSPSVEWA